MPSPATFASPAAGTRIGRTMININTTNSIFANSHARFGTVARVRGRMPFHRTALAGMPRQRTFFTSNLLMRADGSQPPRTTDDTTTSPSAAAVLAAKRKPRSAGAKNSLRRVAAIAQQPPSTASPQAKALPAARGEPQDKAEKASSAGAAAPPPVKSPARAARLRRDASDLHDPVFEDIEDGSNVISAVCLAESFDMERVMSILEAQGFTLDPDGSGFESHEVVHARKELYYEGQVATELSEGGLLREVDLFVFESGTIVGWGLPADDVDRLATSHLVAAAADPFVDLRETETLDFRRDPARDNSAMRGDVVVLGTRNEVADGDRLATTRAQIAFSSGLARSTKLAVLERSFTDYFESTRRIPEMLAGRGDGSGHSGKAGQPGQPKAKGTKVLRHLSQKFVLQKTGELLSLRAQLNHYRELTDALPDIFWDARAELGLESYYEQVGRALDVGVRIKTLNQKMDYAQEIATVLREISSERHGTRLEWIIILLITVEVVFELRRVYLDWHEDKADKAVKDTT
ncbi:hypothetical protein F503_03971 [Ophiostoma piceae UAMH 11346]|uniref:DUF155 domain-containing protein n=1 Tax=Ophiostoma piceae (strain UAMH 11346) TaxID=1262450 RepID=S3BSL0_OPHP1|nr:hypothetical protein F503_03971 [Ophiostoma piceae UAMH 11346]